MRWEFPTAGKLPIFYMQTLINITASDDIGTSINFVPHWPTALPGDCKVIGQTVRPAQPPGRPEGIDVEALGLNPWTTGNPSSLRILVQGDERQFRIKQFLYDWAPPAAGIPSLWESKGLKAFPSLGEVAWLGTDYKGNRALTLQRNRTQIELSVFEGTFSDEELINIASHLLPDSSATVPHAKEFNFFKNMYWAQQGIQGIKVPHGLLKYNARHYYDQAEKFELAELQSKSLPVTSRIGAYRFNSCIRIEDEERNVLEYLLMYYSDVNQSDQLWMQIQLKNDQFPMSFPLEPDDHPFTMQELLKKGDVEVQLAALHPQYGGYEAFWVTAGYNIGIWCTCTLVMNYETFKYEIYHLANSLKN